MKIVVGISMAAAALLLGAFATQADEDHIRWKSNGAPSETYITGGGWTLEQSGAAVGLKSAGYCDKNGNQIGNPGTERMQPYYFPVIQGHGKHLQGYFDWRPKDTDEAVAAAFSDDAGLTWTFQQKVLELRTTCPNQVQKDPDGDKDNKPDPNNSDNGDDDGQGHQFVIRIAGHTYLYTLDRAVNHIDSDDLYIHELDPQLGLPLNGAPAMNDGPTDASPAGTPEISFHTTGLLNPDGILGVVPGSWPLKIIYEQKILNGDNTGSTALPASQQCNTFWANYYATNPFGTGVNDDISYLRLAETTDGVNFKDDGILQGLNDPTDVTATGTRWLATAGTIMKLEGGKFGLLFSGGGCISGDSDAFQYIGYAESSDLLHWTVVNGLNNPVVSTAPFTITVNSSGVPDAAGAPVTFPAKTPIVGNTMGWFSGRVYAPSGTLLDRHNITVIFAGYHTPKPKNGLGDYRTIGHVSLHSDRAILAIGQGGDSDDEDDE
ncbi:MAG TPA: hypothetical protein VE263_06050 [Candidatus Angelobacter sp.]|nr:hypothetical protein [Candidatus Angelobacter sp.]